MHWKPQSPPAPPRWTACINATACWWCTQASWMDFGCTLQTITGATMGLCEQQSDNTDLCSAAGVNTHAPNTTSKSKFTPDIQVNSTSLFPLTHPKVVKQSTTFTGTKNKRKTEETWAKLKTVEISVINVLQHKIQLHNHANLWRI